MNKAKIIVPALMGIVVSATAQQTYAASGKDIVASAAKYLHVSYKYGSPPLSTTSFDCSSFTQYIFKRIYGVNLPRTAALQATKGISVKKTNLLPGDLLFFDTFGNGGISHVGIYQGNGKMISSESYVGVHVTNVFSGGGSESYWKPRFLKARRIISGASTVSVSKVSYKAPTPSKNASSTSTTKITYTVKRGDSLWKIANRYKISITKLKALNKLSSDIIHTGQKLTVSSIETKSPKNLSVRASIKSVSTNSHKSSKYTVKSGDSLWAIATLHGISLNKMMKMNNLTSTLIYPGQKLVIP